VIEELLLPDGNVEAQFADEPFARPLLPELHEPGQWLGIPLGRAEKMDVIWHHDITANRPTVT
jgi:hypothetical protein